MIHFQGAHSFYIAFEFEFSAQATEQLHFSALSHESLILPYIKCFDLKGNAKRAPVLQTQLSDIQLYIFNGCMKSQHGNIKLRFLIYSLRDTHNP